MEATFWFKLIISDLSTLSHRLYIHVSFREVVPSCSVMLYGIPCLFLVFMIWGSGHGGPLTDPHPNITDQQLFWGADQYDFSVVLRAAGQDCFWHFSHYGETFYLNFMVQWVTGVGHDRHLSVTVNAPSGLLVSTVDDAKGQINFKAKETGFYQMCFNNFHNRFGTMQVFLSFGVYYDNYKDSSIGKEEEKKKKEEISKDLNNTLSVIEGATHKVENYIFHMFRYYSFGRMRKSADFFLLLSNSQYITWWSTALSLLIVTSGYLQLLFLKSLFVSKTTTEDEKPRC
uniref:GOLD domain-containing protein n=2 Tax=Amphiprion ocellaris TaxID=80972 RepID=A0A3Q1CP03_AMPOC